MELVRSGWKERPALGPAPFTRSLLRVTGHSDTKGKGMLIEGGATLAKCQLGACMHYSSL